MPCGGTSTIAVLRISRDGFPNLSEVGVQRRDRVIQVN